MYTETKKFSNSLQIRIFISEIHVEINTIFFYSKCDKNHIQYQLLHASLQNFICTEHSVCHTMFSKGQNVNILIILHVHRRWFRTLMWILTYQGPFLDVMQSEFAIRNLSRLGVIWMKRSSTGVSCFPPARSWAVCSQLSLHETIVYSVSNCSMNIKMNNNMINVETCFRHANHSAAFVSGRLLRFNKPKFHHIPITCWCVLSSDRVAKLFCFSIYCL